MSIVGHHVQTPVLMVVDRHGVYTGREKKCMRRSPGQSLGRRGETPHVKRAKPCMVEDGCGGKREEGRRRETRGYLYSPDLDQVLHLQDGS